MELSEQENGHGGGGATISSERDWTGLGIEILEVKVRDERGTFPTGCAGGDWGGKRRGHKQQT